MTQGLGISLQQPRTVCLVRGHTFDRRRMLLVSIHSKGLHRYRLSTGALGFRYAQKTRVLVFSVVLVLLDGLFWTSRQIPHCSLLKFQFAVYTLRWRAEGYDRDCLF